jgi:hypothetical protein
VTALFRMDWLCSERARLYGLAVTTFSVMILLSIIWHLHSGYDRSQNLFGGDYVSFWAASKLTLAGHPADVYVRAVHHLAELPALRRGYEAFYYPPTYLLVCLPFALLPFFPSLIAFLAITGTALGFTIWRISRTPWAIITGLGFAAVETNITAGQNAFLMAAILGSGLSLMDRRPKLAGMLFGCIIIKPHLALAIPIVLIVSRRLTVLLWASATAVGLLAVTTIIFGWQTWVAFLLNSETARETLEQGLIDFAKMQSVFALSRIFGADQASAYAFHAITVVIVIGGLWQAQKCGVSGATERSLTAIACLLVTPFLLHYDLVILTLPLAWMLRQYLDEGFPAWSKPVMTVTFCSPIPLLFGLPVIFGPPVLLLFGGYLLGQQWHAARSRKAANCDVRVEDAGSAALKTYV